MSRKGRVMNRYVRSSVRSLSYLLFSVFSISFFVFYLIRAVPGDITDLYAVSGDMSADQQEALRQELGLDQAVLAQFVNFASLMVQGDWGVSLRYSTPVLDMLLQAVPLTLLLVLSALVCGLLLGAVVALLACAYPGSQWRQLVEGLNVWSIAIPSFCIGVVAVLVFSIWLQWLPIKGQLLMPVLILSLDVAGQVVKPLYEELMSITRCGYVRTARAKGLGSWVIVTRHILPNTLVVMLNLIGVVFGGLVGGTLTMEVIFGLNGVGGLTFTAIQGRDYPLIQAGITWLALMIILMNLVTRSLSVWVDPRLRKQ
ncbi:ABC transporter permease [Alcaligenes aquatilis]